jgi:hypothetical protein
MPTGMMEGQEEGESVADFLEGFATSSDDGELPPPPAHPPPCVLGEAQPEPEPVPEPEPEPPPPQRPPRIPVQVGAPRARRAQQAAAATAAVAPAGGDIDISVALEDPTGGTLNIAGIRPVAKEALQCEALADVLLAAGGEGEHAEGVGGPACISAAAASPSSPSSPSSSLQRRRLPIVARALAGGLDGCILENVLSAAECEALVSHRAVTSAYSFWDPDERRRDFRSVRVCGGGGRRKKGRRLNFCSVVAGTFPMHVLATAVRSRGGADGWVGHCRRTRRRCTHVRWRVQSGSGCGRTLPRTCTCGRGSRAGSARPSASGARETDRQPPAAAAAPPHAPSQPGVACLSPTAARAYYYMPPRPE